MNSYEKIYAFLVEDKVLKATSSQVRPMAKYTAGLSDKEKAKFNRAMTTKDDEGNWRSPRKARRIALKSDK